jgi:uncharacterized pyridoxamine 5'-phosphate oxidase family protein
LNILASGSTLFCKITEEDDETICLVRFDGKDANWHEWSVKTLALTKTRGFKNAYMKDTNPFSDAGCVGNNRQRRYQEDLQDER